MDAKQIEAIRAFRNAFDGAKKRLWLFTLGIVTGVSIVGFFEAIEYQSIYEPNVPWWAYAIVAIITTVLAGRLSER